MTVLGKARKTKNPATLGNYKASKVPESFIATVQKLRRVVIPPNVFEVMGLKEGDKVRVTVEKMEA